MLAWYILAFCRVVIGISFAVSFIGKLRDITGFQQTISQFDILPKKITWLSARSFLAAELIIVIMIGLGGKFLLPGFLGAFLLLGLFSAALASVLKRRIHTSCNCFGASDKPVTPYDIWRNAGFILCALGGCGALSMLTNTRPNLGFAEYGMVSLGAAVFVAISAQMGEIAQLFRTS